MIATGLSNYIIYKKKTNKCKVKPNLLATAISKQLKAANIHKFFNFLKEKNSFLFLKLEIFKLFIALITSNSITLKLIFFPI